MPERNHEVIIDGFVFPDTVTVTLANDEYINSRDYVGKELYESICAANDAWQEQNAKLRELVETVIDDWMSKVCPTFPFCECGGEYQDCTDETCGNQIYRQMARELGVEVDG